MEALLVHLQQTAQWMLLVQLGAAQEETVGAADAGEREGAYKS